MDNMNAGNKLHWKYFCFLCAAVAFVGIGAGVSFGRLAANPPSSNTNGALLNPLPSTMEELVASSEIVAVGTIGDVVNSGTFFGYEDGVALQAAKGIRKTAAPGLPIVDFEIKVEQVIVDDGTMFSGQPLILREVGDTSIQHFLPHSAMPRTGDRRLLFLSRNPDGTYGIKSLMHQIDISGPVAVYLTGHSAEIPFDQKVNPQEFVSQVERISERIKQN